MQSNSLLGPVFLDLATYELTPDEARQLEHPYAGGVVLFSRNYRSVPQLQALIAAIREARSDILIAVDQEGGRVQRFKEGFTRLPPLQRLGGMLQHDPQRAADLTYRCGWLMAAELRALDVDLSFAPVLDADDHRSDVIGDRSFSRDVATVARLGQYYIAGMRDAGMPATAKHFPGHGGIKADSHVAEAVDMRSMEELRQQDLVPFVRLLGQCAAVMPAHVKFPQVDPSPVGFSRLWLQDILRTELAFDGVIFSDDLSMQGAAEAGSYSQRAVAALSAGCDAALICNQPEGAREVLAHLQAKAWPLGKRLSGLRLPQKRTHDTLELLQQDVYWQDSQRLIAALANPR